MTHKPMCAVLDDIAETCKRSHDARTAAFGTMLEQAIALLDSNVSEGEATMRFSRMREFAGSMPPWLFVEEGAAR